MAESKFDWKKAEKQWYGPGTSPMEVDIPEFGFYLIEGRGDPDGEDFAWRVEALYALAYGIRMSHKSGKAPAGFYEYTVYPLEGVWSLTGKSREEAEEAYREKRPAPAFDRNDLVYRLMIRQPDFVTPEFAAENLEAVAAKKKLPLIREASFQRLKEGRCVQMLHLGPYADEPASFARMKDFCRKESLARIGHDHREIYLSDARKTAPDKLKTILRFPVRDDFRCM